MWIEARFGDSGMTSLSRRQFLSENAMGIGSVALAWLLNQDRALATPQNVSKEAPHFDLRPKRTHHHAQATSMISLFQHGGPSHIDLTDPKPELTKYSGTDYSGSIDYSFSNNASKKLLGTIWRFHKHGQCGTELSELLPHTANIVDDICLIRSMHTGANAHQVCIRYFHGGMAGVLGRPHVASWLTYGLGSESQDMPAYVVLTDPGGHPTDGTDNWSNGFLPSLFQGTVVRPQEPRILNLNAPPHLDGLLQAQSLQLLQTLNRCYAQQYPEELDLEARIASYELAARMQTAARDALDISQETQATHEMYGLNQDKTRDYGTRCLLARRLVERGVRFVQIFHKNQPWDLHQNLNAWLPGICRKTDQPSAALVTDLKQRGMLDTTLVHWGGEIGRLPVTQDQGGPDKNGRDHNGQGFSMWLAGGGIKPGMVYGATDEFGHRAVENVVTPNDYQATLLHLFGLDHQQLVYHHNSQQKKLTHSADCRVLYEILKRS